MKTTDELRAAEYRKALAEDPAYWSKARISERARAKAQERAAAKKRRRDIRRYRASVSTAEGLEFKRALGRMYARRARSTPEGRARSNAATLAIYHRNAARTNPERRRKYRETKGRLTHGRRVLACALHMAVCWRQASLVIDRRPILEAAAFIACIYFLAGAAVAKRARKRVENIVRHLRRRKLGGKGLAHAPGLGTVGCTPTQLAAHLESLFLPGMSWENRGYHGWHVDHIRPLSSFDLSDPKQIRLANHYSNLRPMWARDNIAKGAKVLTP